MLKLKFYNFDAVSSTNDKAKEFALEGKYNLAITAKKQLKGRGRFNRSWSSNLGGLYMTLVLKEKDLDKSKYLTLIATISVAKSIKDICSLEAKVKWPNDVLIEDKKACGILTELIHGKGTYELVGIGLNVNNSGFPNSIKNEATSLKIASGRKFDAGKLSKEIIKNFSKLYICYQNKKYGKIIDLWKSYSHTLGKKVMAKTLNGDFIEEAIGVDKDCSLILKLETGELKTIIEADIFVV